MRRSSVSRRPRGRPARWARVYRSRAGGQVYASADSGDSWNAIVRDLPPVLSVEVQTFRSSASSFLRFFACQEDLSLESPDAPLPDAVAAGAEPFMVVGAIAGG